MELNMILASILFTMFMLNPLPNMEQHQEMYQYQNMVQTQEMCMEFAGHLDYDKAEDGHLGPKVRDGDDVDGHGGTNRNYNNQLRENRTN